MSRKLARLSLALVAFLAGEVWALGLGEIRLDSALNEPLRAQIQLVSATPEELANLKVSLASADTFERYGLDRPAYLLDIQFRVIPSGRQQGAVIELRTNSPITEPFLTFLIEAAWARGRLLREYTVLLDPPTFAPPAAAQTTPAVTAPTRTAPADSGRIQRPAPAPEPARPPSATPIEPPRATQLPQTEPAPAPVRAPQIDDAPFATATGGDLLVQRGDTLWGISQRMRPDSRLTINQTMVAIFEANPGAFGGNINMLRAGAVLRIPSADQIFRISRGEALGEVQRQNAAWTGRPAPGDVDAPTRPSLTLVPPDDDYVDDGLGAGVEPAPEPLSREQEIEQRIAEIEAADVPTQRSLIEIRNNELAALREELARIRGEVYEPPVEEPPVEEPVADDSPFVDDLGIDDEPIMADDTEAPAEDVEPVAEEPPPAEVEPAPTPPARTTRREPEPTLLDTVLGFLTSVWMILGAALVIVAGLLFWFLRRGRGEPEEPEAWGAGALDADEAVAEDISPTESLRAPSPGDESFVVVEQGATQEQPGLSQTIAFESGAPAPADSSGQFGSLEDTFSSDTAVNLDQSDPIAEADFHMAYGLYDQAADLVNSALKHEPGRQDLLTKLCEIYFVWGNREEFIDAAGRLKYTIGDAESADWDKIVIMGQQIAADDQLFAGAGVAAASRAVDLSFDEGMVEGGALDMELVADTSGGTEILDIGLPDEEDVAPPSADVVDFDFGADDTESQAAAALDLDVPDEAPDVDVDLTAEMASAEGLDVDMTAELPVSEGRVEMEPDDSTIEAPKPEPTVEAPTIESQFADLGGTTELPALEDEELGDRAEIPADATSEINLDDLGLDVSGLDDLDATGDMGALSDSGLEAALDEADFDDLAEEVSATTGKNPEVDPSATGVQTVLRSEDSGLFDTRDLDQTDVATDVQVDDDLFDATGVTQVLGEDQRVDGVPDIGIEPGEDQPELADAGALFEEADTDDETDYDFARTESLPDEVFAADAVLDETGELPAIATTDLDLDLDDLTAALQVSDAGDTVEQFRDDATVEQPRPGMAYDDDVTAATVALDASDMDDNLHEARTMTEVGTKLDLARAYVDMGDPDGARSILEEVLEEGDEGQRQQAQNLLDSLPS